MRSLTGEVSQDSGDDAKETHMNISNSEEDDSSCVQVAVRIRPMLPHEAGNTECTDVLKATAKDSISTVVRLGGASGPKFTFDQVFPITSAQEDVYNHRVSPLVKSCLEGYNATVLAYGQTGSGKTHTIMGPSASITAAVQDQRQAGVIPRAIRNIFEQLDHWSKDDGTEKKCSDDDDEEESNYDFCVRVQFLEVYGQEIRDLLATTQQSNSKLSIRDVGMAEPEVVGASEQKVESAEEALLCLTKGMYRRVTGATSMNETSSRSHAIFSLIVEQQNVMGNIDGTPKKSKSADSSDPMHHVQAKRSKFNFVDLAGSERQKRTNATGQRLKEGININQGLLVLGNVISALGDPKKQGKTFVPYRDSNLTRLLKGSLGGNHKTLMIACVSPAANNMEESLNCLRYANRAKNIQNHAVVNVDATSRLVSELRGKMQLLAADLLKARKGITDDLSVPIDVLKTLAEGGDSEALHAQPVYASTPIPIRTAPPFAKENLSTSDFNVQGGSHEMEKILDEKECYKFKTISASCDPAQALPSAYTTKIDEYEREIAQLRQRVSLFELTNEEKTERVPQTPDRPVRQRAESPELNRLRAQMFGSMAQPNNLDAEVQAEERVVANLTARYLQQSGVDEENEVVEPSESEVTFDSEEMTVRLEAEVFELSNSIDAKEELIKKLQASRKKYEDMRDFYEGRLKEMESQLIKKADEAVKLGEELSKLDKDNNQKEALSQRLKVNQQQVAELRRKQAELTRLSSHATRNESQISKLTSEISTMKCKKVELQKQITSERKSHSLEVQKLKKESMQQQRELSKVKHEKQRKTVEAEKAQQIAKARLDQVLQLKTKYKESEKRLRIATVKRGVMVRAGLDPVMVGRRQTKTSRQGQSTSEQQTEEAVNMDGLRDYFDQKVADVSRREALAEKLAQEWEEHLDLSSQRDELVNKGLENDTESIAALDSRIKYKEERIRQLASRLGKPNKVDQDTKNDETFIFTREYKKLVGNASSMMSTRIAAKVLFGMVVRERRRIATLARTASSLDEKVQEAERMVSEKESAFRAYVDEQRLEAADLAQQQQQHILSLMNMVEEQPQDKASQNDVSSPVRSAKARHAEKANSKLLLLANERIAVLENQLNELKLGRDAIQKHRERESESRSMFLEKSRECEDLVEELTHLRSAMRHIREEVDNKSGRSSLEEDENQLFKSILTTITMALNNYSNSPDCKPKRQSRHDESRERSPRTRNRRQSNYSHSSDCDEVPDWADDIMRDLETIAKGEMPSSLIGSLEKPNSEAHAAGQSVFERLNNPKSFTGVQKQKKMSQRTSKRAQSDSEASSNGQRHRKLMSKQIANSLDKLVIPDGPTLDTEKNSTKSKEDLKNRSVFDRLLSPSNLTGTQKQRFQDKKDQRDSSERGGDDTPTNESAKPSIDKVDLSLHASGPASSTDRIHDSESISESKHATGLSEKSEFIKKREEYTETNVFERLNKTTTQAYAVKQHANIAEKLLDDILVEPEKKEENEPAKAEFHNERMEAYTQQNVFERLQNTTTRAFSVKQSTIGQSMEIDHHSDSLSSDEAASIVQSLDAVLSPVSTQKERRQTTDSDRIMLDRILDENSSSNEDSKSNIGSPIARRLRSRQQRPAGNVFERLQTTTTEAFDLKKSSSVDQ